MKVIAITGGPCGGKTTLIEAIKEEFGTQNGVRVINEVASALLTVFPVPGRDVELTKDWLIDFQAAVKMTQEHSLAAWQRTGAKVLVSDRGLADGPAYLGDQLEFCALFNCQLEDLWLPYDEVIYVPSFATVKPELYLELFSSNEVRYETKVEEARSLDQRLHDAWVGCQSRAMWSYLTGSREENTATVLNIVRQNLKGE
ncbi:MAG: ATP-binding protein [Candidatus Pacebacteria bacterium]|nr:ATP-binding protein [Candidatus Paceibacterota bacterium]